LFQKKFGIKEAKKVAEIEKRTDNIHPPTFRAAVKATLGICDIPNVVAEEVKKFISEMTYIVANLKERITIISRKDREDERRTEERIRNMRIERQKRKDDNEKTIAILTKEISMLERKMKNVESLNEYA